MPKGVYNKINGSRSKAIRLGQSFTLAEAIHHCKLMEALMGGATAAEARKLAMDPLALSFLKKLQHSRAQGRERLVEQEARLINAQLEAAQ